MGKDISIYVLPRELKHEPFKTLCFDFESEPEKHEIDELDQKIIKLLKNSDSIEDCLNINTIIWESKTGHEKNRLWCQKCLMFIDGIHFSSIVKDSIDIKQTAWVSFWNITRVLPGTKPTEFTKLFDTASRNYSEITTVNIEHAFFYMRQMGTPVRLIDKAIYKETLVVLEFIEKWLQRKDVFIIMEEDLHT